MSKGNSQEPEWGKWEVLVPQSRDQSEDWRIALVLGI